MDKEEAADVAEFRLDELRRLPYTQLVKEWLDQPCSEYGTAPSGRQYSLEIEAVWDYKSQDNLRVWVIVDTAVRAPPVH